MRTPSVGAPLPLSLLPLLLPLLPHAISHWALQVADRFVIAGIVSKSSLGVYVLAGAFAAPVLAIFQAIYSGFMPNYARAGAEPDRASELEPIVVLQITLVVAITLAGVILSPSAVDILSAASYHEAGKVAPWLVLGYGFVGLYFIPMSGAVLGAGRRKFAFVATLTSAVSNIVLVVLLTPAYGIVGAAIATAAAYFMLLVLISLWANARPTPVRYRWAPIMQTLAAAVVVYVGSAVTTPLSSELLTVLVRVAWVSAFVAEVAVVQMRSELAGVIRRMRRR